MNDRRRTGPAWPLATRIALIAVILFWVLVIVFLPGCATAEPVQCELVDYLYSCPQ